MKKHNIGLFSATFLGVSCVLGSGWLFSPYKTAVIAGPSALITWVASGFVMLLLALCFAEVASLYPKRGISAVIPSISHNKFFGFPFALVNWLGIVAVIGLEADATIQYLINLLPQFQTYLFSHNQLTWAGNSLSISLILLYSLVNYWGAKTLTKANNILSVLKVIVPIVTALIFMSVAFHPHNFTAINSSFMPYGMSSIVGAILTTGIIVSFNGFQSIVSFASEIKNPQRTIPLSLVISLILCLLIYLLLQIAFIGAVPPATLAAQGWHSLQFSAPMIQLSLLIGLSTFTSIIYFGATVAPSSAGITFTGAATRMCTAMARSGQMPEYFNTSHPQYHVSRRSLFANMTLAIMFLILCRSWSQLAEFISLFHILSYLPIPLALCIFRRALVTQSYPFRLRGGQTIAFIVFATFTYLFTLGHLKIITEIFVTLLMLQAGFIAMSAKSLSNIKLAIKQSLGVMVYFTGMWLLTYISPTQHPHTNQIEFVCLVTLFSAAMFFWLLNYQTNDAEELSAEQLLLTNSTLS